MKYISAATVVLISFIMLIGCSEDQNVTNSNNSSDDPGSPEKVTFDQILADYGQYIDTTKVIGEMRMEHQDTDIIDSTSMSYNTAKASLLIYGQNDSAYAVNGASVN